MPFIYCQIACCSSSLVFTEKTLLKIDLFGSVRRQDVLMCR
jgi:hypothetical protein